MIDAPVRRALEPTLNAAAAGLVRLGVRATALTIGGWCVGVVAIAFAATGHWHLALVGWLFNRVLDGLDGPVARLTGSTDLGGFLDIVADFSIYGGFLIAAAIAVPEARLAALVLLGTYYLSGTAFLALSSVLERRGEAARADFSDGRSLLFVGGLAEGTETVVVYVLICLMPQHLAVIAWIFAVAVMITAVQRIALGIHLLRGTEHSPHPRPLVEPTSTTNKEQR